MGVSIAMAGDSHCLQYETPVAHRRQQRVKERIAGLVSGGKGTLKAPLSRQQNALAPESLRQGI